jgi:hypothetical protein
MLYHGPHELEVLRAADAASASNQGLTLIHFSAQHEPFMKLQPACTSQLNLSHFTDQYGIPLNLANKTCSRQAEKWTSSADKQCSRQDEMLRSVSPYQECEEPKHRGARHAGAYIRPLFTSASAFFAGYEG